MARWTRFAAPAALLALAGCAGNGPGTQAIVKTLETGHPPATVGLLYPQVEPGASDGKGRWPGGRKIMGSEIGAMAYVQVRGQLEHRAAPGVKDLSAEVATKARTAMLGASVHREYSLNGNIPVSRANELGRAANVPACLLISVIRYGPSDRRLELKSLAGLVKEVDVPGAAPEWINCGVVAVLFRTPGGEVLWEAGHLASLPAGDHTQEQAVEACIAGLFGAYPWKK